MPKLELASMGDQELSDAVEAIAMETHRCTCDKQGRISLTENLMAYAGLTDQVQLNGMFSMFRMVGLVPVVRENDAFGKAKKLLEQINDG
jgi:DNA-binding transcriptional regulator/RsmH inhibitor MraZ